MRIDKEKIILERKKGKSYSEISKLMKIPKSTLSLWLRDDFYSKRVKKELQRKSWEKAKIRIQALNKKRGIALEKAYAEAREEAEKELKIFKNIPLFIAGLCIYWGEGEKTSRHFVRVSNIDPFLLLVFKKFLTDMCGILESDMRCSLLLYPDLSDDVCKKYWEEKLQLQETNFRKSTTIQGRHKTKKVSYGVCNVAVGNAYLKEKMMVWLAKLPKELVN